MKPKVPSIIILSGLVVMCGIGFCSCRKSGPAPETHGHVPSAPTPTNPSSPAQAPAPKPAAPPPITGEATYSSFGPSNTFRTNGWTTGNDAHADWFVAKTSGELEAIELGIEPLTNPPGRLTVFIARDRRGHPGGVLESLTNQDYPVGLENHPGIVAVYSVVHPALEAGVKYWLCVGSTREWRWHYNNKNLMQNALNASGQKKWQTAGYCAVCASSVFVTTNRSQ